MMVATIQSNCNVGETAYPKSLFFVSTLVAGCLLFCIYYLYIQQPSMYLSLVMEDGFGEYLTAMLYFGSAVFLFLHIHKRTDAKLGYYLLLCCFVFMAGEEISWGQRIFDISTPDALVNLNYQHEITLHNLVQINQYLYLLGAALILWSISLLFVRFKWFRYFDYRIGVPLQKVYHLPFFLLALFFIFYSLPLYAKTEIGELLLGLAFFVFSTSLVSPSIKYAKSFIAFILLVVITLATYLSVYSSGEKLNRSRELADYYKKHQFCRQALVVYDKIIKDSNFSKRTAMRNSPHQLAIEKARMFRYAERPIESEKILKDRLNYLSHSEIDIEDTLKLEQLGDIYLHLNNVSIAHTNYRNALLYYSRVIDDPSSDVKNKYQAYISFINIHAKLGDVELANMAREKWLALDTGLAQGPSKEYGQLADYWSVKDYGSYPITLKTVQHKRSTIIILPRSGHCQL
jgi:hypothetical protein